MFDDVVMSDVKEEEVANRITKMAAELHFSGDRSSKSPRGSEKGGIFFFNVSHKTRPFLYF